MAITNSDGRIILTTRVEDAGLKKGMAKIISDQKTQLQSLKREYAKFITNNKQNTEEAKKLKDQIDKLSKSIKENEGVLQSFEKKSTGAFSRVGSALKGIAGHLALAFSVTKIIQFSNEAGQLATQTEASVQRLVDIYGSASNSVGDFIDANARALGMSKAAAASFSSVYGNLFSVWADQETNAQLTNEYLRMTAVVASKTGRTVEDVQERVRSGLLGNTEAIEDLGIFVNVKTIEMTDAFQRMSNGKSWEQLDAYTQQQIRSMAILEQATAKYGDEVAETSATTRARYQAAYQDFQNSWGNIVSTVLLPVLQTLTQIFDIATKGLNSLAGKSGQILENAQIQEEAAEQTTENIEEQVEAQKDLNKEMKKTLAGFDDIQILSSKTAENENGGSGVFDGYFGGGFEGSNYVEEVDETLGLIMGIVGFSLAAIGILLLCFGNIGWGLGFIIAGASIFMVSESALSADPSSNVASMLNTIVAIASAALLALGVILLFTPASLPLAIGFIIAGAAGLVAEAAINWDAIVDAMQGTFGRIMAIVSGGLIVLGIILCFTGVGIGLGIGLILAGAAGLDTVVAFNWDAIVDWIKNAWDAVKAFWNKYIAPIFTVGFWLDLAKKCGNGLIGGFEAAINGIIGMFEKMINWIVDGLNKISISIPDWVPGVGGKTFGFNIPRASFGRVSIPRLAQGAVIPPNREFLAVLGDQKQGTNIEAPLQTIVDAFNIALSQNGGYNGGNTEVVLEVDGREFGRAVVEQGNRENRRIGTRLVIA